MGFGDVLKRIILPRVNEGKKMTPEETELEFYKKREYNDNLKRKLRYYRAKAAREHITGSETLFKKRKGTEKKIPKFGMLDGGFL